MTTQKPHPDWKPHQAAPEDRRVMRVGPFVLLAWSDGSWSMDIVFPHSGETGQASLEAAQLSCESAFRNLLADAARIFKEGL